MKTQILIDDQGNTYCAASDVDETVVVDRNYNLVNSVNTVDEDRLKKIFDEMKLTVKKNDLQFITQSGGGTKLGELTLMIANTSGFPKSFVMLNMIIAKQREKRKQHEHEIYFSCEGNLQREAFKEDRMGS